MSNFVKFIRIGRSWINPKHITSVGVYTTDPLFKKPQTFAQIKLSTQQSEIGGNWFYFTGEQKRCCIDILCKNEKDAELYIKRKFVGYLE